MTSETRIDEAPDDRRPALSVVDAPDRSRYELRRGDDVLGRVDYHWEQGRVVLDHTVVDRARRERGLGSVLARGVLEDLRERDLRAVPACPFIRSFIAQHPEFADLVAETPSGV